MELLREMEPIVESDARAAWLAHLREMDLIDYFITWFLYNLYATGPCIVGVLLVKYGKGKWAWRFFYAIGLIHWAYEYLWDIGLLLLNFSFYTLFYFAGETVIFALFLIFYEREIRKALKRRESEKEDV